MMSEPFRLPRSIPAREGVSPEAIAQLVHAWEQAHLQIHSMMLIRNDHVIAEAWWAPYQSGYTHILNSLSKSFTSVAVGFAVQDGLLRVEDSVLSFFPHRVENPHENMKKMKVRHLLTMSTGHSPTNADFIFQFADPVGAFLSSEVPCEPGSVFVYNTGATYMLSAIIRQVTGKKLMEYLNEKFLQPLGISDTFWETCPLGNSLGGFGFNVKTEDIAKLGLFMLHEGRWNGQQLLDPAWIREATGRQIRNDGSTETPWLDVNEEVPHSVVPTDWNRGYGYQFWRCIPKDTYRADGAFGQYSIVMPDQNAVLAITAGVMDMKNILTPVWEILLPAMTASSLPVDSVAQDRLQELLCTRAIPVPEEKELTHLTPDYSYQLPKNRIGLERIAFHFSNPERDTIIFTIQGQNYSIHPGKNTWHEQHFEIENPPSYPFQNDAPYADIASAGAWISSDTYELKTVCTRYAYVRVLHFTFIEDRILIEYHQNLACPPDGIRTVGYRI